MALIRRPLFHVAGLTICIATLPSAARAQTGGRDGREEPSRRLAVTFGAGAIAGTDTAGDFTEPMVAGSVQRALGRYVVLDGELARWHHTTRHESGARPISNSAGDIIGQMGESAVEQQRTSWNGVVHLLLRTTPATLTAFGGVGAGLMAEDTVYLQAHSDCSVPSNPAICRDYRSERSVGPAVVLRALGGVDVRLARHVGVFGTVRSEVRGIDEHPQDERVVSFVTGIRISSR